MAAPVFDQVLLGGAWVPAGGGTYPIIDPATEEVAGHAPECTVEQARAAARAARQAFEDGPWPRLTVAERAALLERAADVFEKAAPGLVDLTIAETGSLRPVAQSQQVGVVPLRLRACAALGRTLVDEGLPPRQRPGGMTSGLGIREMS